MSSNFLQSDSDFRSTSLNNIEAIIKCYICLGKIKNPCMCPLCQKLTCEECIKKWLLEKKSQCPHCRVNLNYNQLIHLSFMTDVANYIDNINSSKKVEESEICKKHQINNLYYCVECETPLCSDCYMLEDNHKNHKIKKIDEIFKIHLEKIKQENEGLDFEEKTIKKYLKDIKEKIIEIGDMKYKKMKESEEFIKNIRNQIQIQSQEVITNLLEKKQNLENKLSEIQNYSKNLSLRIKNSSKNDIITQSNNIIKELKEIKLRILTENSDNIDKITNNNLTLNIQNPLVPKYETGIYEIKNYEKIKSEKVIYSPDMVINGLIWKLKLYPKGNVTSKGECISVFLELQSFVSEPSKYFYVLELVNFKNGRNYFMEYSSNFSKGECWGYSNFYKIKKLKEDGFINPNGDIIIKVHIRPETFEQLSRDLKGYIQILEKMVYKKDESIIGEEDEDNDNEENDYSLSLNLTGDMNLKLNKFTKEFFSGLEDEFLLNKRKIKNKTDKIYKNKNYSLGAFDFDNNGIIYKKYKNRKKIKKSKNDMLENKNMDKIIHIKKNNNFKDTLSLNNKEGININKQNLLLASDNKNLNFKNNGPIINNNNINNINNINTEPENKFNNLLNYLNSANLNNNIKLSTMARIDVSLDSEEEQKKTKEDPFIIPKKKNEDFIIEDDSFDFFEDSMKISDENKDKKDRINRNSLDELKINLKNNMDRKKGKERDYGRGRNNNNINNYDRNYIWNYGINYLGNENGQNNSNNNDNSSSNKYKNDFEIYKKKYYK